MKKFLVMGVATASMALVMSSMAIGVDAGIDGGFTAINLNKNITSRTRTPIHSIPDQYFVSNPKFTKGLVGAHVGVEQSLANFFVGGEVGVGYLFAKNVTQVAVTGATYPLTEKFSTNVNLLAKLGFSVAPMFKIYGLGGVSFADFNSQSNDGGVQGYTGTVNKWFSGWVLGAGASFRPLSKVGVDLSYRYASYSSYFIKATQPSTGTTLPYNDVKYKPKMQTVLLSVSYYFI